MADPISWGLIDDLDGKVDVVKIGVEATGSNVDFLVDGVQQLKTDTITNTETINGTNAKMDKLVQDVHDEIQADPSGVPAPHMAAFNLSSTKEGIKVDYTVNVGIAQNGQIPSTSGNYNYSLASVTKGVMVRYSDTHFPTNREDGDLAFIDEDVLTTQSNGQLSAKAKSQIVTSNMVMNHTYYFTAFPCSKYNVYNEQLGTFNCKQAQYVGDVGFVKVSVSADEILTPLNYTLTLTGGGNTYTKQGNGNSEVAFNGVKSGTYTLTASAVSGYATPSQQSLTVTGGQTKNTSMLYRSNITFATATWADIDAVGKTGKAPKVFNIGDSKNIQIGNETITVEIVDFNHDDLQSGGKAPMTFGMKNLMRDRRKINTQDTNEGGFTASEMYKWMRGTLFNSLPKDLKTVIKPVNKKTSAGNGSAVIKTEPLLLWLFSEVEVAGEYRYSKPGEGYVYPVFTDTTSRIKRLSNGSGGANYWWLRSPYKGIGNWCCVSHEGTYRIGTTNDIYGVCFAFCV